MNKVKRFVFLSCVELSYPLFLLPPATTTKTVGSIHMNTATCFPLVACLYTRRYQYRFASIVDSQISTSERYDKQLDQSLVLESRVLWEVNEMKRSYSIIIFMSGTMLLPPSSIPTSSRLPLLRRVGKSPQPGF